MQTIAPMAKGRTTIHDIARELNITASTVSRALNGNSTISERTRSAVLEMADKLDYKPNHIAAALRSGRSKIVGVIVPAADRNIFAKVIRGIEDEVAKAGYSVIVCQTYEDFDKEKQVLETLLRTRVDGILASIAKNSKTYQHYRRVREEGIPLIFFDRTVETVGASTITINDFRGAFLAVDHLIKQGCRRVAHFAGQQHINIYKERYRGYQAALEAHGLKAHRELVVPCTSDVEEGKRCAKQLLELDEPPDAIFSSSDYAALGAMQWLKRQGISIPNQIAIVGFANEPFTSYVEPALTSVDQHSNRMGRYAAKVFLEEIGSKDKHPPRKTVMEPELIIRASSLREL